jgi:hypothetical protein
MPPRLASPCTLRLISLAQPRRSSMAWGPMWWRTPPLLSWAWLTSHQMAFPRQLHAIPARRTRLRCGGKWARASWAAGGMGVMVRSTGGMDQELDVSTHRPQSMSRVSGCEQRMHCRRVPFACTLVRAGNNRYPTECWVATIATLQASGLIGPRRPLLPSLHMRRGRSCKAPAISTTQCRQQVASSNVVFTGLVNQELSCGWMPVPAPPRCSAFCFEAAP